LGGLELRDLQQVFWYQDAQTDDAALTRAVMASARALGARLLVPARFSAAELRGDDVLVRYAYPNDAGVEHSHECHARVLINAAGPWADAVADCITPAILVPKIERVQGSHILLPLAPPSPHAIYYVESPRDGRAIFVMPWHAQTLVGTTEARFHGDPAQVTPSSAEIHYLLGVLKHYFPRYRHCSAADLSDSFAGVRVLPSGAGHAFHRSRETLLLTDRAERPRVLSIYGGKLTGWRAVSKRVLQAAARSLPRARRQLRTDEIALGRESQR
jgi:glycerol-3-phosphate dehydrogenase